MTVLRGPADAERFRVEHYRQRWYRDPLPSCKIADATDEEWISITAAKKAWSKEFMKKLETGLVVPLDGYRCGKFVAENKKMLYSLDAQATLELVAGAPRRDLNLASRRGTSVHKMLEECLKGEELDIRLLSAEARPYYDICQQLVADLGVIPLFTEVVSISREIGVGGTADVIAEIPVLGEGAWSLDWKTRNPDSEHGAYEEEACQVVFHAVSDYYIVDDGSGNAIRVRPPEFAGGLVISIKADSYALFPVDIETGRPALENLVIGWRAKRSGQSAARASIGKEVFLETKTSLPEVDRDALVERFEQFRKSFPGQVKKLATEWPAGLPTFKSKEHTQSQLRQIEVLLFEAEKSALMERLSTFDEMRMTVVTEIAKDAGVPNIKSSQFQPEHVAILCRAIGAADALFLHLGAELDMIETVRLQSQNPDEVRELAEGVGSGTVVMIATEDGWELRKEVV
jgi:hypothetical protein